MKYPFKFLDAYTKEDRDIFFGRDQEIEALYRLVFQTNLLLVYGGSGTGKTSIIRCGLANRFKPSQWQDLYIRRGANINRALLETIEKHLPALAVTEGENEDLDWFETLVEEEAGARTGVGAAMNSDHPVARALHQLYLANFTPIYLIFDQFEELYTLGEKEEQLRFVETITELVQLALPLKIILVMREEYLAKLYDLEVAVPQLRDKKLRIEPMDLPRVEEVILHATLYNENSNVSLAKGREQEIARAIIEKIREGDINIKLPYLQVFMDRLYELTTGEPVSRERPATIGLDTVHQAGYIGDVLADFIERQSQRIYQKMAAAYGKLPADIIWQILSPFATVDGTKVPIRQSDIQRLQEVLPDGFKGSEEGFVKRVIGELESARILRFRKEDQTYEVAHDTLAKQIAEKRSEEEKAFLKAKRIVTEGLATYADTHTLLSKEQLAYIRPFDQRLAADLEPTQIQFVRESERRRRRQIRQIRLGVLGAFVIALLVIFLVFREQQKTKKALDDFLEAQAAREKTELDILLQRAAQIAKGNNCPPERMRRTIDSLYRKYDEEVELQNQYQETMSRLGHCN